MVKWLSGLFDSTDKEHNRLRRIVAEANEEIVALLESQRDNVAAIREETFRRLSNAGAGPRENQGREMARLAWGDPRLAGHADTLHPGVGQRAQTSPDRAVP